MLLKLILKYRRVVEQRWKRWRDEVQGPCGVSGPRGQDRAGSSGSQCGAGDLQGEQAELKTTTVEQTE